MGNDWILCFMFKINFPFNKKYIFQTYFSKSTGINSQYSILWDTMLFTQYLIKWKGIGRMSWKFQYWLNLKLSIELHIKRSILINIKLAKCPFNCNISNNEHYNCSESLLSHLLSFSSLSFQLFVFSSSPSVLLHTWFSFEQAFLTEIIKQK